LSNSLCVPRNEASAASSSGAAALGFLITPGWSEVNSADFDSLGGYIEGAFQKSSITSIPSSSPQLLWACREVCTGVGCGTKAKPCAPGARCFGLLPKLLEEVICDRQFDLSRFAFERDPDAFLDFAQRKLAERAVATQPPASSRLDVSARAAVVRAPRARPMLTSACPSRAIRFVAPGCPSSLGRFVIMTFRH
jgi:hypothetical protein